MIYLVRHGQTAMNRKKVLQGRSDIPLNEEGRKEAAEAGERFRKAQIIFDRVYAYPLIRAWRRQSSLRTLLLLPT